MLYADIKMEEGQFEEEEVMHEGMPTLENASLYVELEARCNAHMWLEMLEMMSILKSYLEILKVDNVKLMNAKSDQEEINELLLKSLTSPLKQNGQNSCSIGKKIKWSVQSGSSEETKDIIHVLTQYLKKDNDIKFEKQNEKLVDLQGEFQKLRPPMFDAEYEEVFEAWLLNIKWYFHVYVYDDNLSTRLAIFQQSQKAAMWW